MERSGYQTELEQLKRDLAEFRDQISTKADDLAARIDSISHQLEKKSTLPETSPDGIEPELFSLQKQSTDDQYNITDELIQESEDSALHPQVKANNHTDSITDESVVIEEAQTTVSSSVTQKSNTFINAFNWLVSMLVQIGPFARLIEQITRIYQHYQEQGKTPVFLMTTAGIITLVIGFGYLLQYSFTEFLSIHAKFTVCYLIGLAVSVLGCWICIKKPLLNEYGSSLIGLGVIIEYLVTYFLGPYYEIISGVNSFLLLTMITLVSYALAITFETKVVATVTLLGGALSPIVTGQTIVVNHGFVFYLFLLALANLHIAYRINWQILANIALFTTLGLLEYGGYFSANFDSASTLFLFSFFYLFSYYWGVEDKQPKSSMVSFDLIALNTVLFYFIYACFSLPTNKVTIGIILLINTILVTVIFRVFRLRTTALGPVASLMASLQLACALFALMPLDWFGILLGIEGLVLVYFGYNYQAYYLRLEGYFLYIIALIKLIADVILADWFSLHLVDILVPLLGLVGLFWCCFKLNQFYHCVQKPFEKAITNYVNEGVSLASFSTWLIICLTTNVYWLAVVSVPLIIWLMWRNQHYQLKLTEWLVYAIPLFSLISAINTLVSLTSIDNQFSYFWLAQPMISWLNWLCIIVAFSLVSQLNFIEQFKLNTAKLPSLYQGIAYAIIPVFLFLDITSLLGFHVLGDHEPKINSILWCNFAINLLIIAFFIFLFVYFLEADNEAVYEKYRLLLIEAFSIGLSVFFLYTVSALNSLIWLNLAIIPWAILLSMSLKFKLKLSEIFSWLHPLCFIISIIKGGVELKSFHFSDQLLITKLAWVELLFSGWALPLFYRYFSPQQKSSFIKVADIVRVIVYLAIPLIPLPHIYRHYPQFIVSAFWLSLAICWGLNQFLKLKELVVEFYVIFYMSTIITVFSVLISAITIFSETTLINIVVTLISVALLFLIEYPFKIKRLKQSNYRLSFGPAYYLCCFCIAALVYGFTNNLAISLLPAIAVMIYCQLNKPVFAFMHSVFRLNYIVILLQLFLIPNIVTNNSVSYMNVVSLLTYGMIAIYLTHKACYQNKLFWLNYKTFNIQIWIGHGILMACYLSVIKQLFGNILVVATTISLLVHALVVLFMTLKEYYRNILKLSLLLFSICTIKLIFYDIQDYTLFHKMLVMLAVGSILLIGAYQFQRVKEQV